ncbi:hypothetical protein QX776_16680 [Alteromonadaceae bacterium BrNp21-10]|nr:hypothetical protein [Alteromonadaceae bacterium BrNp21-10]
MKIQYRRFLTILTLMCSTSVILLGCNNNFSAAMRKVTYPPDFKYVTGQELRSGMDKLAYQLQMLDSAVIDNKQEPTIQQQKVLESLRKIEKIALGLQANEAGSSHPYLQNDMSEFVKTVSRAKTAASFEKPQYYLAGRVSGGCTNCHKINR